MRFKGKHIDPYESFYWDVTDRFNRGQLGGGISRTVKTTDSLAIMEENIVEPLNPYKDGTCRTIKAQYQQSSRANFARQDGLGATGVVQIGNIYPDTDGFKNRTSGRVYSAEGSSPTLRTVTGGHNEPKVVEEPQVINPLKGLTDNGWHYEQQVYDEEGITRAVKAGGGSGNIPKVISEQPMRYRIRKLTPRECFRLMDVDENVIDTIQAAGISNSQQYKLAGNSIVVACLEKIFEQMFFPQYTNSRTLFG